METRSLVDKLKAHFRSVPGSAILLAVLISFYLQLPAASAQAKGEALSAGIEFRYSFFGIPHPALSSIPASVRQVPGHQNDPWRNQVFTIPDDNIKPGGLAGGVVIAPELGFWQRIRIRAGINWAGVGWPTPPQRGTTDNTKEINQYGRPQRGIGTALVYYSVRHKPASMPAPMAELEVRPLRHFWVLAGFVKGRYSYVVERGWDRYDSLETLDVRGLSTVWYSHRYVGIRIEAPQEGRSTVGLVAFGGPARVNMDWNNEVAGTAAVFNQRPYIIGAGVTLRFSFRRVPQQTVP